jgi:hypothetical protein
MDEGDFSFHDAHELPLFKKGMEIYEIIHKVSELIPDEDPMTEHTRQFLREDALMLTVKVTGAEAAEFYDIKMENAALIRKAARSILAQCSNLKMMGFKETYYLDLIREEIENYRLLFVEWVRDFDKWTYVVDEWGLFNPPGIEPEDREDEL